MLPVGLVGASQSGPRRRIGCCPEMRPAGRRGQVTLTQDAAAAAASGAHQICFLADQEYHLQETKRVHRNLHAEASPLQLHCLTREGVIHIVTDAKDTSYYRDFRYALRGSNPSK